MYTRKKLKRVYAEWLQIRDGHLLTALSQRERSLHKDDTVLKFATVKQDVQAILEDCWPSQMQQRDKSEFFAWRRHNIDIAFKVAFSIKNWMLDAGISQQYIQDRAQEIQWLAYAQPNALTDHQWAAIVSMVSDWPESIACANAAMCARIIDVPSFKNMRTLEKYQLWSLTGVDALMATVFDVQIASKDASRTLMALFIDDEAAKSYLDQWLSQASARGYRHVVERLATMLPNDFQVPTACLCEAAFSGNIEMIALLLQLPATDISRVDRAGNDPGILLAVGVQFGGYDVVKALLSHPQIPMVKKGVENRVVHYSSDVPFIHACATNDVALVDLFLRHANSTHKIDINQIYASKVIMQRH